MIELSRKYKPFINTGAEFFFSYLNQYAAPPQLNMYTDEAICFHDNTPTIHNL